VQLPIFLVIDNLVGSFWIWVIHLHEIPRGRLGIFQHRASVSPVVRICRDVVSLKMHLENKEPDESEIGTLPGSISKPMAAAESCNVALSTTHDHLTFNLQAPTGKVKRYL